MPELPEQLGQQISQINIAETYWQKSTNGPEYSKFCSLKKCI